MLTIFNSLAIVGLLVAGLSAYLGYRMHVFWFEREWLSRASEIRIEGEKPLFSGEEIESFLERFAIDNERSHSIRTPVKERKGVIVIDGKEYDALLVEDKFVGESLGVRTRWKYLEFFNSTPRDGPGE